MFLRRLQEAVRGLRGKRLYLQHGDGGNLFDSHGAETFLDMYFFQHRRSNSSEMWPRLPGGVDGEGRGPQQQWQK